MSIMFPQTPTSVYQIPKCFVTYGAMGHVDPLQPPSKGKPWATIMSKDFIHKVSAAEEELLRLKLTKR